MKKHTKFVTLLLALAMLMVTALPLTAFAAGENGSITIIPFENHILDAGDFNAYKLFDVTVGGTAPNRSYAYKPVAAVADFLAQPGMADKYGANADAFLQWLQKQSGNEVIELAKDLTTNKALFTAIPATQDGPKVKIDNLDFGYYLVTGAAGRDGQKVINRSSLVTIPCPNCNDIKKDLEITHKSEVPEIDKEVYNHNTSDWADWTDVNVGDTVKFKLTSRVPYMSGYDKYTFIVHDTMSKGLTFDPDSVVIAQTRTIHGFTEREPIDPSKYTVTTSPATDTSGPYVGGTKIDIEFNSFNNTNYWELEILYEATLNEHAIVGAPGNPNKVYLEYSNNPYDETSKGKTPEEEVIVYTFDMKIYKYTGELPGTPLPGAEFELSPKTGDGYGDAIAFIKLPAGGTYDYRVAKPNEAGATTVLVSNADGLIRIEGLDAGEYGLKETKAPDGYNLLPGWITTVIVHKAPFEGNSSLTVDGLADQQQMNVLNNAGGKLPGTGGIGTYIFFGLGIAMALLLATAFVAYRKKKTLDAA